MYDAQPMCEGLQGERHGMGCGRSEYRYGGQWGYHANQPAEQYRAAGHYDGQCSAGARTLCPSPQQYYSTSDEHRRDHVIQQALGVICDALPGSTKDQLQVIEALRTVLADAIPAGRR
jgi:hypothetical protein